MIALEGKRILVTGAAGGIGSAASASLARAGARLFLVDRDEAALQDLAVELAATIPAVDVGCAPGDVTSPESVRAFVSAAVDRLGGLDGLFNNAGVEGDVAVTESYPEEAFDQVMGVNVKGVWLTMREVIPVLRANGAGAIVNTGSGLSLSGLPGMSAYVASKHAVLGLTRTAALELAEAGIRVNAICPGPVTTRMMDSLERLAIPGDPGGARRLFESGIPMARYASPAEIGNLVAFLLSDAAPYMTGSAVSIDGGVSAR